MGTELLWVLGGTGFTFFMTAVGAAMVFIFKGELKAVTQKMFLGFAAGVMIAASIWSLLLPAIEMNSEVGKKAMIPVAGGFILGGAFLMLLDSIIPHLHKGANAAEGIPTNFRKTTMLVLAVTLHNVPEGMAVAVAFLVAYEGGAGATVAGAIALAIGMGIQNLPEGAAIALPLREEGLPRYKAFLLGAASGLAEPVGGILTLVLASKITTLMPWILSFAAGAMIYVVVEELIPDSNTGEHTHAGTVSIMLGFLVMMLLDVLLG